MNMTVAAVSNRFIRERERMNLPITQQAPSVPFVPGLPPNPKYHMVHVWKHEWRL